MRMVTSQLVVCLALAMTEPTTPQNTNSTIYVVTYIDIQQNSVNSGIALVQRYREATRAEKGASRLSITLD